MTNMRDRITGTLYGQAVGDALGAPYEYSKASNGHAVMQAGGFGWEKGEWTDDTQQAIIVAQAKGDVAKVAEGLIAWIKGGPNDVGTLTGMSLRAAHGDPAQLAEAARAVGLRRGSGRATNGSLMRTSPVALSFLSDRQKIAEVARQISDLTHYDPFAGDACVLWSLAIDLAVREGRLDMRAGLEFIPEGLDLPGKGVVVQRRQFWQDVIKDAEMNKPGSFNGPVVEAFKAAYYGVCIGSLAPADGFETGIQATIDLGGDTDTVGAIAGSLLGALFGKSRIPAELIQPLHGWTPHGDISGIELEAIALDAAGVVSTA